MKPVVIAIALFFPFFASAQVDVKSALKRPMITGASVSADYSTASPGKRLALRYTQASEIKTIARPGRPGRETLKDISANDWKDRTSVLALDLFFWDSAQADSSPSIASMKKIIEQARTLKIPLVLGEIPELLRGRQVSRAKLNAALRTQCLVKNGCYIMPFEKLHTQLMKDGYIEMNGMKMTLKDIVPDGRHLSETASNFLADRLEDVLRQTP